MECANCGTELNTGDLFCPACGTSAGQLSVSASPEKIPAWAEPPATAVSPSRAVKSRPSTKNEIMGVGAVIGMYLLMAIPIIGQILMIVWAFGSGKKMRKNIAAAHLILMLLFIGFYVLLLKYYGIDYEMLQDLISGI